MKVEFGLSNVHVGAYEVGEDGQVTMGEPMKIPGAVGLKRKANSISFLLMMAHTTASTLVQAKLVS